MLAAMATAATSVRHKRPRGRQQMDLFDSARPEAGGAPLWPELPERARSALMELMAQLILGHAAKAVPLRRQVSAFMSTHSRVYPRKTGWTMRYLRGLQARRFEHPAHEIALQEMSRGSALPKSA